MKRNHEIGPPICYNCKHLKPTKKETFVCDAFPGGIPGDIVNNVADHRKPFEGDRGIRFDAIDPDIEAPDFGPEPEGLISE